MIGIAGENLVRFACVDADWSRNAGRAGIGAILGTRTSRPSLSAATRTCRSPRLPAGMVAEAEKAYA